MAKLTQKTKEVASEDTFHFSTAQSTKDTVTKDNKMVSADLFKVIKCCRKVVKIPNQKLLKNKITISVFGKKVSDMATADKYTRQLVESKKECGTEMNFYQQIENYIFYI